MYILLLSQGSRSVPNGLSEYDKVVSHVFQGLDDINSPSLTDLPGMLDDRGSSGHYLQD